MNRDNLTFIIALFCALSINTIANAQTLNDKSVPKNKKDQPAVKPSGTTKLDQLADERRAFAIQLVMALANEARSYKDDSLRASIQARAADVLWDVDQEQARLLFNRAWDVAETVDKDGRRRNEEERKRFLSGRGGTGFIPTPPNLRAEVLQLVSRHDRALSESLLAKMEEQNRREEEENGSSKYWDPTEPPEAIAKRLELAIQLLERGETESALQIAAAGLNRVTSQSIIFLVILRNKNKILADQYFASLLEKAATDPTADATAVSLLASYAFTPSVLVTATRRGLLMNPWTETLPPPDLSTPLRATFFRVATQILLRPASLLELDQTTAGRTGTYFTILRLLPLFDQFDPNAATVLRTRLNSLAQNPEEIIPAHQRAFVNSGFARHEPAEKESEDILSRLERASSTGERDQLYALAARLAAMKDDPKAKELADKIEDAELRKRVRNFVDFVLVTKALEKSDAERAIQLARTGELSSFQRAWVYTELAGALAKSAPERIQALLDEAVAEARRIDVASPESAQAWISIARRTTQIDRTRIWETVAEAVKAINRVPGYAGEESKIIVRFQSRNNTAMTDISAPSLSLSGLFEALAQEDIYLTADMARTLNNEAPRAVALLAAARSEFKRNPVKPRR
ncbi:MAG TPA: hypothetical protein VGB17_08665 [Pyrinomonadaceae bacterium]|jgi:hypothetical protein